MKNFLKNVFAVIVGISVIFCCFIFIIIVVSNSSEGNKIKVKDKSILKIDLSRIIKEQNSIEEFQLTSGNFNLSENLGLQNIVKTIKHAKTDDRIKGIYLPLSTMPNGFATADILRKSLQDFKSSNKFVISYGEYVSQKAYYVASVSDKIYINPEGIIELRGIGVQLSFYKKFLDKIEAEVQVFKVGTFKSAIEPFIREDISEPNREQLEFLLGGIKTDFINNISKARGITSNEIDRIINELQITSAKIAVDLGFIDEAYYSDQVFGVLSEKVEKDADDELNFIDINKYGKTIDYNIKENTSENGIAIVYAEGEIVSQKTEGKISSEEYAKIISDLRNDDDIKAIVLRVNSPGGSALASEVIWREIELAKKTKKVVVSMGNIAASGGYYIACGADYIFSEDNTITGSIGVFGLVPNFDRFLENKIGVTFDEVNLNTHATMNGVTKKFDELEHKVIQSGVDRVYETFTNRVAEGRDMDIVKVKENAEGRVWTGEQALKIGFVDEIGDLNEAIDYTIELAEIENDYYIEEYPKKKEQMELILEQLGIENVKKSLIKSELGSNYKYYEKVKSIESNFNTIQMRIPFDFDIK